MSTFCMKTFFYYKLYPGQHSHTHTHTHRAESTHSSFLLGSFPLWILGRAPRLKRAHHLLAGELLPPHPQPLAVDCHREGRDDDDDSVRWLREKKKRTRTAYQHKRWNVKSERTYDATCTLCQTPCTGQRRIGQHFAISLRFHSWVNSELFGVHTFYFFRFTNMQRHPVGQ